MHLFRRLLCSAILLGLCAGVAVAAPVAAKEASQYRELPQKRETPAGKAIEVIEFFAYYCPHCNVFEPRLAEWVKKQGDNIVFKRVHISAGTRVLPQQRLFYTLEALGLVEQYHSKAFAAMHEQGLRFGDDEQVANWAAQAGIDRARFVDTAHSFGVQARLRRASAMMNEYQVDHWPLIVVDGRYITSPSMANPESAAVQTEVEQQQVALQVMDLLLAKAKADKK